ncbi:hypothetical protein SLEP1_g10545 [Rubroshorea leprosula]|uniref:Protein kinase domain-containing protein n=1 Tax=Rubroshorea leprosula TaxID=152421 RepID=A0AAV5IGY4_9ROSI|nr:hypothetical protein SLEP1_g10545 [Rubroshorea leprosula]
MLMENFLWSKEYWTVVEAEVPEPTTCANDAQRVNIEKEKLKDLEVKNYLFQAIDWAILETILNKSTSKNIWDSMKKKYQGNERVRRQQRQASWAEFEVLQMQIGEFVDDYFARTMAIVNKMRIHGENLEDVAIVEKILLSMTTKFNYVVCSIEESNNIEARSLDELQNSLLVHEQKINHQDKQEQAVQISQTQVLHTTVRAVGRGKENWKGRPRSDRLEESSATEIQKRNDQAADNKSKSARKGNIECFRSHKYGHYRFECRANLNRGESSNFAEHNKKNDDSSLFMVDYKLQISELKAATNNFDDDLKIGKHFFGPVYKGLIDGGSWVVAVKRLDRSSLGGTEEFRNEAQLLCQLRHQNLVSFLGFCHEKAETRDMHWGSGAKYAIIHRGVKPSTILLDENWDAKLSDFGFSMIGPSSISKPKPNALTKTHSRIYGTYGYIAPEYASEGEFSVKIDVYALAPVSLIEFVEIALNCVYADPNERPSMGEVEVTLELALELQEKADLVIKAENPHAVYAYEDVSFRFSVEKIWLVNCDGSESDAGLGMSTEPRGVEKSLPIPVPANNGDENLRGDFLIGDPRDVPRGGKNSPQNFTGGKCPRSSPHLEKYSSPLHLCDGIPAEPHRDRDKLPSLHRINLGCRIGLRWRSGLCCRIIN